MARRELRRRGIGAVFGEEQDIFPEDLVNVIAEYEPTAREEILIRALEYIARNPDRKIFVRTYPADERKIYGLQNKYEYVDLPLFMIQYLEKDCPVCEGIKGCFKVTRTLEGDPPQRWEWEFCAISQVLRFFKDGAGNPGGQRQKIGSISMNKMGGTRLYINIPGYPKHNALEKGYLQHPDEETKHNLPEDF